MARLRLFASAREAAGVPEAILEGGSVAEVLAQASRSFGPRFDEAMAGCRVWVNGEPAELDTEVSREDEVALLPPVSGGSGESELASSGGFVYTHGHQDAVLESHRWRNVANSAAYLIDSLAPGLGLLDLGCGPGTLTIDLARIVAPGRVVGVDISAKVVGEAEQRAKDAGIGHVSFVTADFGDEAAMAVAGVEAGSFDVVHAHQVLQHLPDPVGALRAMRRYVRPGGLVAVRDADYRAMSWAPENEGMAKWMETYLAVTRRNRAEAAAGRWLLRWASAAGFEDVAYSSSTWTFASARDREWWAEVWAGRCVSSSFAEQAVAYGIASAEEMEEMATAWREWAREEGAVFVVPHGEVVAKV